MRRVDELSCTYFCVSVKSVSLLTVGQRVDDSSVERVSGSERIDQRLRRKGVGMNDDAVRT